MVVAYIFPRDTLLQPGQIDARSLTRINYAFANIAGGRMITGYRFDAENFAFLNGLKKDNPSLKVLVSVGGWLWSTKFPFSVRPKQGTAALNSSTVSSAESSFFVQQ